MFAQPLSVTFCCRISFAAKLSHLFSNFALNRRRTICRGRDGCRVVDGHASLPLTTGNCVRLQLEITHHASQSFAEAIERALAARKDQSVAQPLQVSLGLAGSSSGTSTQHEHKLQRNMQGWYLDYLIFLDDRLTALDRPSRTTWMSDRRAIGDGKNYITLDKTDSHGAADSAATEDNYTDSVHALSRTFIDRCKQHHTANKHRSLFPATSLFIQRRSCKKDPLNLFISLICFVHERQQFSVIRPSSIMQVCSGQ